MKDELKDFFEPVSPPPPPNEPDFAALINGVVLVAIVSGAIYGMHHFAHAGPLGSVGIAIILIVLVSALIFVMLQDGTKKRSYGAATIVLGLTGGYFLIVNLETAKPLNDADFQQVYKAATGQNPITAAASLSATLQ